MMKANSADYDENPTPAVAAPRQKQTSQCSHVSPITPSSRRLQVFIMEPANGARVINLDVTHLTPAALRASQQASQQASRLLSAPPGRIPSAPRASYWTQRWGFNHKDLPAHTAMLRKHERRTSEKITRIYIRSYLSK